MSTSKSNEDIWLCLHFPDLPVEVFSRQSKTQQTPVVVTQRQRVAFMNPSARNIGILAGSSMNTALTINQQVVSFERNDQKELEKLEQLAQWAYQFTPCVTIKPPSSLILDVSGCMKLFKGLGNLKASIGSGLEKLGFRVSMGINRTPLSALLFAEAGMPDNLGEAKESLGSVPIHHLRIDDNIKDALHSMGISSCKQLLQLPVDGLNRRYGVFFTDYLSRLTGEKPDPQKFISDRPRFRSDVTFMSDVTNLESLVFPMKRLLGELQAFLTGRQLQVNQFSFKLSHRSHQPKTFTVFLANPDNDQPMFLMLSQLQLEKINDLPEVDNLALAANHFFKAESDSGDLFHGTRFMQKDGKVHRKAEQAKATRLINMMTARLGPQSCFGLSAANDHRPELAWKPMRIATKPSKSMEPEHLEPNVRPLFLLPDPKQLSSANRHPTLSGKLELLQGPERIDFGWWDDNPVARDYYIARHSSGSVYWIFLNLKNDTWYLHGIFS
ncbi:MAG: DNA polymerase Y family protein [Pseudomonadales bacterium]|nr:DNA polymerase Y family protein [Pseudomonadales bacterium]MBO6595160.1 DNA polymerase Y family protein [Pseudomonadales bacterium]MBO6656193.1 DNA polymerase Y family protein [Pseudomonadales bacterium]MBO6701666.1 DNA polymerase Y family protein [Pseudomonadales bacterium]MBO6821281.1 DNA polymerase Y family protein [Pseudomonadales bacterium]